MSERIVKIATRGSKLALYQAHQVKEELEVHFPEKSIDIQIIKTKGDKILDTALSKIGDKGLFTKELENSLLQQETDLAVHSLKDVPTELPEGLKLAGVLERGDVRDALVSIRGKKLADLDETDVVGTSSLRRKAQLMSLNGKIRIVDIRGNVDTRLQKMADGHCTAMIMACAGLQRLGHHNIISEILDPIIMIPAVSQGAIAIETRENDSEIEFMVNKISHLHTLIAVEAERVFLHTLEGGCQIPIGCFSEVSHERYKITGFVSRPDGSAMLKDSMEGKIGEAGKTARRLAQHFLDRGAGKIIHEIRTLNNL